ncbi:MAG: tRNA (N(6)-L-threonylcarbamoyladenosine(37)-C(2))-methylthiotransferase MtaB [Thermodesulfobacteriota bacterium]|nr:tRNA (N(6)-L-threonylcarbamoyladenosine(37)-C(2))-methylthiotransferase MtaB [Thermodesulfobacteriota bacterium]
MKKVAVTTLGCKVNQFESASFITGFKDQGCEIVPASQAADIFVINTCTVTGRAGQQSRQLIRKIMRDNPDARLVVTGCYAQMAAEELLDIVQDNPLAIVGNGNKHLLVETALTEKQPDMVMLTGRISAKKEICPLPVRRFSGRTRAFLRIQDGCNNFCTYCIVPYTRGRSRSLPMDQVLEQVRVFADEGYLELVITGINVGKYGLDLEEGEDIYSLLETICRDFPSIRIRLSSVEPTEVNDRLLELMTGYENFMPHLHIPLQSGDDGVLVSMNRRYTTETFVRVIQRIRSALPHGAIGCDILGGFPGEDEQAAENTFRLIEGLPISYLHVFPYSKRPGTLAAEFKNQVPGPVKAERVARLRKLGLQKSQEFYRSHIGTEQNVLVEQKNKKTGLLQGFSENYIPVRFRGPASCIRTIVRVRIDRIEDGEPQAILLE